MEKLDLLIKLYKWMEVACSITFFYALLFSILMVVDIIRNIIAFMRAPEHLYHAMVIKKIKIVLLSRVILVCTLWSLYILLIIKL